MQLSVTSTKRTLTPAPRRDTSKPKIVIFGAGGVVGKICAEQLSPEFHLAGYDVVDPAPDNGYSRWFRADVADGDAVLEAVDGMDFAIFSVTGASLGWSGLLTTEIVGARNVLDACIEARVSRVILMSSNHVSGWSELEALPEAPASPIDPRDPPRPDGLYAAAKVFVEAVARAAAEEFGQKVSVLRLGTVRAIDDIETAIHDSAFSYIGDDNAIRNRLRRSWLHHADLANLIRDEIEAQETFRLRYGSSFLQGGLWTPDVHTWTLSNSNEFEL